VAASVVSSVVTSTLLIIERTRRPSSRNNMQGRMNVGAVDAAALGPFKK